MAVRVRGARAEEAEGGNEREEKRPVVPVQIGSQHSHGVKRREQHKDHGGQCRQRERTRKIQSPSCAVPPENDHARVLSAKIQKSQFPICRIIPEKLQIGGCQKGFHKCEMGDVQNRRGCGVTSGVWSGWLRHFSCVREVWPVLLTRLLPILLMRAAAIAPLAGHALRASLSQAVPHHFAFPVFPKSFAAIRADSRANASCAAQAAAFAQNRHGSINRDTFLEFSAPILDGAQDFVFVALRTAEKTGKITYVFIRNLLETG